MGEVIDGEFLWELANPLEIDPVAGVTGSLKLWTLAPALASAVESAGPRSDQQRGNGDEDKNRGTQPALSLEPRWALEDRRESALLHPPPPPLIHVEFAKRPFERLVQRVLQQYYAEHQSRGAGALTEVRIDHRMLELGKLFEGREWVFCAEFELVVRSHLFLRGDALRWDGDGPPPDEDSAYYFDGEEFDTRYDKQFHETDEGMIIPVKTPDDVVVPGRNTKKKRERTEM